MEKIYTEICVDKEPNGIPKDGDRFIIVDAWRPYNNQEEKGLPTIIKLCGGHIRIDAGNQAHYDHEWEDWNTYKYQDNDAAVVREAIRLFDKNKAELYE